jgi:hypothetical protein
MRKRVEWTDVARADVRRIDQATAMRILEGLSRFLFTEEGDVKLLKDSDPKEYRLRIGLPRPFSGRRRGTAHCVRPPSPGGVSLTAGPGGRG